MKEFLRPVTENMLFRICATLLVAAGGTYSALTANWLWLPVLIPLFAACLYGCIDLHNRQMRKVIFLLDALENNDNALRFREETGNRNNRTINRLLNRVARILSEVKTETVQQEKYYELILSFIHTGVIVLNDKGAVHQKNSESLRLLGLEVFTHVRQLDKVDPGLMEKLQHAGPGDTFHVTFSNEQRKVNLLVQVSGITIREERLRIFALNDINSELDEKELDSWIRLIRILTHEIMNAVTPIASLSDTLLTMAGGQDEEIRRGLQTISNTGKGLLSFVESYRKFTRIPTPEPALFYVRPFVERMVDLAKHQYDCDRIAFDLRITPDDLILYADENLIAQVVINLMKNAIEAIGAKTDGWINIRAYSSETEEVRIEIGNNGAPIEPEVAEQIFVPFFTTKQGGSGIGLSLSRQIMRLSGGSITLKPAQPSDPTTFILRFK
jgi:nitrogen fixation/metabolism regulation signal transduction histidine kinase